MIRLSGRRDDGTMIVQLIIGPESLARLATGQPLVVGLSTLLTDALLEPVDLIVEYTPAMQAAIRKYAAQAVAEGVDVKVLTESPRRPQ